MSAPAGPFIVSRRESCEDCHGTGERHPTTRSYMSHEIRDCETCERRGEVVLSRWAYATLEEAREAAHDGLNVYLDTLTDGEYRALEREVDGVRAIINALVGDSASIKLPDGSEIVVKRFGGPIYRLHTRHSDGRDTEQFVFGSERAIHDVVGHDHYIGWPGVSCPEGGCGCGKTHWLEVVQPDEGVLAAWNAEYGIPGQEGQHD